MPQVKLQAAMFWAEGIDAFARCWEGDFNWLCPPVKAIPATISHACKQRAKGTLVVPFWPTSYFWPLIFADGSHAAPFVRSSVRFYGRYVMGNILDTCVFNNAQKFDSLALQVDFDI